MAKQNFLAGGYYGKLGATVGQRWKNIRTIRTYVIPHNPRTPAQQANRNKFAIAVPFAQLGQQTNFGSILFNDPAKPEWAIRMSSAIANINAGMSDVGIVPTYPEGFRATYTITSMDITAVTAGVGFTAQVTGDLPEGAKAYSALLYLAEVEPEFQYLVCAGVSTAEHPDIITFTNPNTQKLQNSPIVGKIISVGDETTATVVASAKIPVSFMGGYGWTWSDASYGLDTMEGDGTFYVRLEKDGIGDGTFTGSVTGAFTEGTVSIFFSDGTSDNRLAQVCQWESVDTEHYDGYNCLLLQMKVPSSIVGGKEVERLYFDGAGLRLTFTNYRQNGYSNDINDTAGYVITGDITP